MLELSRNLNLQACARMMMENENVTSGNESQAQENEVLNVSIETAELSNININETDNHSLQPRTRKRERWNSQLLALAVTEELRNVKKSGSALSDDDGVPVAWVLQQPRFREVTRADVNRMLESEYGAKFLWREDGEKRLRLRQGSELPERWKFKIELTHDEVVALFYLTIERSRAHEVGVSGLFRTGKHCFELESLTGEVKKGEELALVHIDGRKAAAHGIKFFAESGTKLTTTGDCDGRIPPETIVCITSVNNKRMLFPEVELRDRVFKYPAASGKVRLLRNGDELSHYAWVAFLGAGVDQLMLIDTGAQISVLQMDVYLRIPEKLRPRLENTEINITVGNGENMTCEGVAVFEINLGYLEFQHRFFVCRNVCQCILGNDFLVINDGVIQSARGKLFLRGKFVPMFNKQGREIRLKVQLVRTVVIPQGREVDVPARIDNAVTPGRVMMFEPKAQLAERSGILMPGLLYSGMEANVRVRMFNMLEKPVTIHGKTILGEVEEVEQIESLERTTPDNSRTGEKAPKLQQREHRGITVSFRNSNSSRERGESRVVTSTAQIRNINCCGRKEEVQKEQVTEMLRYEEMVEKLPEHVKILFEKSQEDLTPEYTKQVYELLQEYSDIFAKDSKDIGKTTLITHDVNTGNAKPVSQQVRRQSPEEHAAMKKIVEELHRVGVVQPSRSQWAASIRMAKKKNGSWRMCIDYRDLNKRTVIHDPYPLPRIDSMLDALGKGRFFSCLDLISGYHQVPMTKEAQERSAFITP